MNALLVIVGFVACVSAKDLTVGHEGGKVIFKQNVTASPAIWRQARNLTVNATEYEVITRVVVIDNREDKNGEATIVEGGEGHKNVTIELKSPAVFRGYDFEVQVFAKPEDGAQVPVGDDQQTVQKPVEGQAPKDNHHVNQGQVPQVPSTTFDNEQQTNTQGVQHVQEGHGVVQDVPLPTVSATTKKPNGQVTQTPKDDEKVTKAPTPQVSNGQQEVQHPAGQVSHGQQVTQHPAGQVPNNQHPTSQVSNGQQEVQHPAGQVSNQQQEAQHPTGQVSNGQQAAQHPAGQVSNGQQEAQHPTSQVSNEQQQVQQTSVSHDDKLHSPWETINGQTQQTQKRLRRYQEYDW